jgi:hypothetical protein
VNELGLERMARFLSVWGKMAGLVGGEGNLTSSEAIQKCWL